MRIILAFTILLSANFLFAQDTKKITLKNDVPEYKETVSVLKENPSIKHGHSEKIYIGSSAYKEEGDYNQNRKIGIWKYYNYTGQVEQQFDYDNDSMVYCNPFNAVSSTWILKGDSVLENRTGRKPILLGGDGKYTYYLRYLRYPHEAVRREGAVFVSARVTSDGALIDEKIEKKLGEGYDEEALKVIKALPDEWIPLKINGVRVDCKVLFRVRFRHE